KIERWTQRRTYVRSGFRGPTRPRTSSIRRLHKKHLLSIPFEDLDIHLGRLIILRGDAFYDKIIKHLREGFAKNSMGPSQHYSRVLASRFACFLHGSR